MKGASRRPKVGDTIFYELTAEGKGRVRAGNASIQGLAPQPQPLKKQKPKKRGLVETVVSLGTLAVIALFVEKFSPSRSPAPDTSITSPAPDTSITKLGCPIKGNISIDTGNKIYHLPGMEDYKSTVVDPKKGEKWFCTESEAIAKGWRKAPR